MQKNALIKIPHLELFFESYFALFALTKQGKIARACNKKTQVGVDIAAGDLLTKAHIKNNTGAIAHSNNDQHNLPRAAQISTGLKTCLFSVLNKCNAMISTNLSKSCCVINLKP